MTEDIIELYDTFNTKGCPYKLIFSGFNDQPIPSDYYNVLNNYDYDDNNITVTPVDGVLLYNKVVEDAVVTNDEYIDDEIILLMMVALPQTLTPS